MGVDGTRLLSVVPNNKTGDNVQKLEYRKFHTNLRKSLL